MAQAKWLVLVDWSGNGGFPVAAVDVSEDVIDLTLEHFRDRRTGYVESARAEFKLRKVETGRHATVAAAPYTWSASERRFLQVVTHGESVRVFVDDGQVIDASTSFNSGRTRHGLFCSGDADHAWRAFGGWVSLFHGVVDTIHPRPRFGAQYCYVRALDDMERLTSVTLHTQATSAYPQTSDEILGDVLDRSGAEAGRHMDTGAELVPRLWSPPLWGVQALDTIYRLQDEEDGLIYVDGHGPLAAGVAGA